MHPSPRPASMLQRPVVHQQHRRTLCRQGRGDPSASAGHNQVRAHMPRSTRQPPCACQHSRVHVASLLGVPAAPSCYPDLAFDNLPLPVGLSRAFSCMARTSQVGRSLLPAALCGWQAQAVRTPLTCRTLHMSSHYFSARSAHSAPHLSVSSLLQAPCRLCGACPLPLKTCWCCRWITTASPGPSLQTGARTSRSLLWSPCAFSLNRIRSKLPGGSRGGDA